ncbi:MAG: hypothetical protein JWL95_2818 [Gemmatimonadetes bacterium]|nr:hypothetical protein [Gemmatimonadota bacterium]
MSTTATAPARPALPPQDDSEFIVSAGPKYTPAPAGPHSAVCCDLINKGKQPTEWKGQQKMVDKIRILFMIDELDEQGKPYIVGRTFTKSLSLNANLRKFLNDWRGKDLTEEEADAFNLVTLLGAPAMIQIEHNKKDDRTYADIGSIMRLPKGMARMTIAPDYVRVKDRPQTDAPAALGRQSGPGAPGAQRHPEPEFEDFPGALPEDDELPF